MFSLPLAVGILAKTLAEGGRDMELLPLVGGLEIPYSVMSVLIPRRDVGRSILL